MKEAPLFVDAYQMSLQIFELELSPTVVADRVRAYALDFVEAVALALRGEDVPKHLEDADATLLRLRLSLRLLIDLEPRPILITLTEKIDGMGRQIGGWKRKLGRR